MILLVSLQSFATSIHFSVSDTTKPLTLSQVDSLIKLSEGLKTLRERFNVSIKEAATYRTLWESEKDARAKDKADYAIIIDGYAAIDQQLRNDLAAMTRRVKKETRLKRLWQVVAVAAGAFGIYQSLK